MIALAQPNRLISTMPWSAHRRSAGLMRATFADRVSEGRWTGRPLSDVRPADAAFHVHPALAGVERNFILYWLPRGAWTIAFWAGSHAERLREALAADAYDQWRAITITTDMHGAPVVTGAVSDSGLPSARGLTPFFQWIAGDAAAAICLSGPGTAVCVEPLVRPYDWQWTWRLIEADATAVIVVDDRPTIAMTAIGHSSWSGVLRGPGDLITLAPGDVTVAARERTAVLVGRLNPET